MTSELGNKQIKQSVLYVKVKRMRLGRWYKRNWRRGGAREEDKGDKMRTEGVSEKEKRERERGGEERAGKKGR